MEFRKLINQLNFRFSIPECINLILFGDKRGADKIDERLLNIIEKKGAFAVYGGGATAYLFLRYFFEKYGLCPQYILDREKKFFMNQQTYLIPDDIEKVNKETPVIIAVGDDKVSLEIKKRLINLGFINVIRINSRYFEYVELNMHDSTKNFLSFDKFIDSDSKLKILNVYDSLDDLESKQLYYNIFKLFIDCDKNLVNQSTYESQYFDFKIFKPSDYKFFVDCGAYIGDTLRLLADKVGTIEKLICFEPDIGHFNQLLKFVKENYHKIAKEILCLPIALSNYVGLAPFYCKGSISSLINYSEKKDENLSTAIMTNVVSLDSIIYGLKPTFIKMDIEGEEFNALEGAKNIISEVKPNLAISVYHHPTHLWSIPNLIKTLEKKYKIYLRKYSDTLITEIILYAKVDNHDD